MKRRVHATISGGGRGEWRNGRTQGKESRRKGDAKIESC